MRSLDLSNRRLNVGSPVAIVHNGTRNVIKSTKQREDSPLGNGPVSPEAVIRTCIDVSTIKCDSHNICLKRMSKGIIESTIWGVFAPPGEKLVSATVPFKRVDHVNLA